MQVAAHAPGKDAHGQAWQPERASWNAERHSTGRAMQQDAKRGILVRVNKHHMRRQLHMPQAKKDVDRPGSQRRRNGKFRGMVLERLGGRTLDAELAARRSGLQDVHFIREVLFQVWRLQSIGCLQYIPELCGL